jgi:putative PIN family toxin of toxin-antitoxin system
VGKRKITLDTNIFVSALGWKGNPHKIMQKVVDGELGLFMSYAQSEELSRVLDYPKFGFTKEQKTRFMTLVSQITTFIKTPTELDIVKEDPSDNRILECALAADVDFIVSGDEHLLSLEKLGRIRIVSARDFLEADHDT